MFENLVFIVLAFGLLNTFGDMHYNIMSNGDFNCLMVSNFYVKCFGENGSGQLGLEDTTNRGGSVNTMGDYLELVNLPSTISSIEGFVGGALHNCILSDVFDILCWGGGSVGQLGSESSLSYGENHLRWETICHLSIWEQEEQPWFYLWGVSITVQF